jgi:hypothetical protein
MLKVEMEYKIKQYEEILKELGRWSFPIQYGIDEQTPRKTLLFHLKAVRQILNDKFYKL